MSVVDEIKERLDVVDLIQSYIPLTKAGRSYKALCPFHSEKTPSFVVFPESQGWHCFGACSTGGDIFSFVMKMENVDFSEALRMLAERAGIQITPLDDVEVDRKNELERLRAVNQAAAQFFHHVLMETPQGEQGLAYFQRRGVTAQTMAAFQLGYAPQQWHDLEAHLQREHFDLADLLTAGLVVKNDQGNVYDRFRGRIIFPIRDVRGHVIGFGGRVLDDSVPKYLNTPQTPLFDKGSVLYGIDLAREAIRTSETVVIVEGYMDVVIPYQCGVHNLVACMGTALTENHIRVLKRLAKRLILALDPDEAGVNAVEKGVDVAQEHLPHRVVPVLTATGLVKYEEHLDAEISVVSLPDGLDPDELVLQDRGRWDTLIDQALPVADYFFRLVMEQEDVTTARGKRAAADRLLPVIAAMDNPVSRSHHLQQLSQRIQVDERDLYPQLARLRGDSDTSSRRGAGPRRRQHQPVPPPRAPSGFDKGLSLEQHCLSLMLLVPEVARDAVEVSGLQEDAFRDVRNRQVFQLLLQQAGALANGAQEQLETLDSELAAHVESVLQRVRNAPPLSNDLIREDLLKSLIRLQRQHLSDLMVNLRFLQQEALDSGGPEAVEHFHQTIELLARDVFTIEQRYHAATLVGRKHARETRTPNHEFH